MESELNRVHREEEKERTRRMSEDTAEVYIYSTSTQLPGDCYVP